MESQNTKSVESAIKAGLGFFRGRVALAAILNGLGVKKGEEVAIQALTCVAVPEALMSIGVKPLYIDVEENGINMDPESLRNKLTQNTKAIIAQHTFGIPAQMEQITAVAENSGIPVIEDNCHTLNAVYSGQAVGSFGVASFYSFEWGKPIVAGTGGIVVANEAELRKKIENQYDLYSSASYFQELRLLLQFFAFSFLYRPSLYWSVRKLYRTLSSLGIAQGTYNSELKLGTNLDFGKKMMRISKQILMRKIHSLESFTAHSALVSDCYRSKISSSSFKPPFVDTLAEPVYTRYPLLSGNKQELLREAQEAKIEVASWFDTPVHPLKKESWGQAGYRAGECPCAEKRGTELISLPTHLKVSEKDANRVVDFLNGF